MGKAARDMQAVYDKVHKACVQALMNASDDLQSTQRDVVRRWKNRPDFGEETFFSPDVIEFTIKPKGSKKVLAIYKYVDKGTKPHIIKPKIPGTYLKFRGGYSAMTQPIAKYNVGSGMSFGSWVSKSQVNHPGNAAREFMKDSMEKLIPSLQQRVQTEITKSVA